MYIRLSDADKDLKFKTESESIANNGHSFIGMWIHTANLPDTKSRSLLMTATAERTLPDRPLNV